MPVEELQQLQPESTDPTFTTEIPPAKTTGEISDVPMPDNPIYNQGKALEERGERRRKEIDKSLQIKGYGEDYTPFFSELEFIAAKILDTMEIPEQLKRAGRFLQRAGDPYDSNFFGQGEPGLRFIQKDLLPEAKKALTDVAGWVNPSMPAGAGIVKGIRRVEASSGKTQKTIEEIIDFSKKIPSEFDNATLARTRSREEIKALQDEEGFIKSSKDKSYVEDKGIDEDSLPLKYFDSYVATTRERKDYIDAFMNYPTTPRTKNVPPLFVDEDSNPMVWYRGTKLKESDASEGYPYFRSGMEPSELGVHVGTHASASEFAGFSPTVINQSLEDAEKIIWDFPHTYPNEVRDVDNYNPELILNGESELFKIENDKVIFNPTIEKKFDEKLIASDKEKLVNIKDRLQRYYDRAIGTNIVPLITNVKKPIYLYDPGTMWNENYIKESLLRLKEPTYYWPSDDLRDLAQQLPEIATRLETNQRELIEKLQHVPKHDITKLKTHKDIQKFLVGLGFDSVVYTNRVEGKGDISLIIFNNKNLKSAIGNYGEFNPKRDELNFAEGGLVNEKEEVQGKVSTFNPDGSGYDYSTAIREALGIDSTGHWPSRAPISGQILKDRGHPTYSLTEQGEAAADYAIQMSGRGYSAPAFQRLDPGVYQDDAGNIFQVTKEGQLQPLGGSKFSASGLMSQ